MELEQKLKDLEEQKEAIAAQPKGPERDSALRKVRKEIRTIRARIEAGGGPLPTKKKPTKNERATRETKPTIQPKKVDSLQGSELSDWVMEYMKNEAFADLDFQALRTGLAGWAYSANGVRNLEAKPEDLVNKFITRMGYKPDWYTISPSGKLDCLIILGPVKKEYA